MTKPDYGRCLDCGEAFEESDWVMGAQRCLRCKRIDDERKRACRMHESQKRIDEAQKVQAEAVASFEAGKHTCPVPK